MKAYTLKVASCKQQYSCCCVLVWQSLIGGKDLFKILGKFDICLIVHH